MDLYGLYSSKTGKDSFACDLCSLENPSTSTAVVVEESKPTGQSILELSSCPSISTGNDMCMNFMHKMDGYVYKRRKLQRNGVALMSEDNVTESSKDCGFCHSATGCDDCPLSVQKDNPVRNKMLFVASDRVVKNGNTSCERHNLQIHETPLVSRLDLTSEVLPDPYDVPDNGATGENKVDIELSDKYHRKSDLDYNSSINDRYSISKSNNNLTSSSGFIKNKVDMGECSSLNNIIAEPLDFHSSKELCIFVLKTHGLLSGASENGSCASLEVPDDQEFNSVQSCKICHELENSSEMLICDLCEEAFHVSCCKPKIRKLPVDEWYCQPCSRKKPKTVVVDMPEHKTQISSRGSGSNHIAVMLQDSEPYTTGVRIGKDFQAEVPEWSGPISDDFNPFGELLEVDPAEYSTLNVSYYVKTSKSNSIGNWVQCREVLYACEDDKGTVCGKWRRAPLFADQTDDWDCSCAVLWDPIHADCAVPQELETEVILKHLKFVEMLRPRLEDNKQKFG